MAYLYVCELWLAMNLWKEGPILSVSVLQTPRKTLFMTWYFFSDAELNSVYLIKRYEFFNNVTMSYL